MKALCKTCQAAISLPRVGQRYCSHACQQSGYRKRQKSGVAVTQKRRLYPYTGCRHENTEISQLNQRGFSPPTYYFVEARSMSPSSKGMMPPGPPPPLSAVEVAVLGGFVATVKQRSYQPASASHAYADNPAGPTPGALNGDGYSLEYDANGYPELPACLDRRKPKALKAAA